MIPNDINIFYYHDTFIYGWNLHLILIHKLSLSNLQSSIEVL